MSLSILLQCQLEASFRVGVDLGSLSGQSNCCSGGFAAAQSFKQAVGLLGKRHALWENGCSEDRPLAAG